MTGQQTRRPMQCADTLMRTGATRSPGAAGLAGKGFPKQESGSSLVRAGLVTVPVPAGERPSSQLWCDRADCPVGLFEHTQLCPGCRSTGYPIPTLQQLPLPVLRVLASAGLGR